MLPGNLPRKRESMSPKTSSIRFISFLLIFTIMCFTPKDSAAQNVHIDTLRTETLPGLSVVPDGTIFVSPNGEDETGDGSIEQPFRTIIKALSVADSGDVINCREGTYHCPYGIRFSRPGITLQSHPAEWAKIETSVEYNGDNEIAVYMDTNASYTVLRRLEISGGYYYGISTETRWDWGDPDDRTGCSHILVEDCIIHDTGRDCIKIKPNCDDITIRRCEIYNSGKQYPPGETDGNAEGIDNVNGDFMLVQDCYIHDIFSTGIYFKGGAIGGVVERCRIDNCGVGGVMIGFDTSPEYFDLNVNPHYYENMYGIVRNCFISDTRYAGIGLYAARGARVLNNTLVNVAKEGHAALYFGITFQDWDPAAERPPSVDPYFYNNLIIIDEISDALAVGIRFAEELGGLSALQGMPAMDNNIYYNSKSYAHFEDNRPDSPLENGNLSAWQQHIQDEFQSMECDPLLDLNGHPLENSAAIDAGRELELVSFDLDQNVRSGLYDIGAFEITNQTCVSYQESKPSTFCMTLYPNPANHHAYIQWVNPERQMIEIILYNSIGQKLQIISNGVFDQGIHKSNLHTAHFSSGLYFVKLISKNRQQSRKLQIIK